MGKTIDKKKLLAFLKWYNDCCVITNRGRSAENLIEILEIRIGLGDWD